LVIDIVFPLLPNKLDEILDAFVLDDQTRLVEIAIEALAEEHINLVNQQNLNGQIFQVFGLARLSLTDDMLGLISY